MVEDAELLRRYAEEKSEAAFAELVQRHLDLVYSAALRRLAGDAHAAADIAQQVFTALARQASSLTRCAVLPGWLYATTRNVAVDFIRAEQRRRTREQEAHTMHELTSPPPSDTAWEQLRPLLDEAMDELSDADREIVVLRFFARRPFADIGGTLRVTEDAARMRVDRALEKLHLLLARRGITSTVAALTTVLASESVAAVPVGLVTSVASSALDAAAARGTTSLLDLLTSSKGTMALGGAAVLAVVAAFYETSRSRVAAASLAAATRENATFAVRLADLEAREQVTERERNNLTEMLAKLRVAKAVRSQAVRGSAVVGVEKLQEIDRALVANPKLRQLFLSRSRINIRVNYLSWFNRLHWTPAQIEAFVNFVFDYASQLPSQPNYQPEPDMASDPTFAAALRARFGEAVAQSFAQGQSTIVERRIVEQIFGSISTAVQPLTANQADRLTEILAAAHPPMHKLMPQVYAERWAWPGNNDPLGGLKLFGRYLEAIDWDQVLTHAEKVLAFEQLDSVRGLAAKTRMAVQLRRASAPNDQGGQP